MVFTLFRYVLASLQARSYTIFSMSHIFRANLYTAQEISQDASLPGRACFPSRTDIENVTVQARQARQARRDNAICSSCYGGKGDTEIFSKAR